MMAISQVKLNHTENRPGTHDSPHTGLYSTGENIASGYSWNMSGEDKKNEGKGPFSGWYGWEKKLLQDFYNIQKKMGKTLGIQFKDIQICGKR